MLVKEASAVNAADEDAYTKPLFPENNLKSRYTYSKILLDKLGNHKSTESSFDKCEMINKEEIKACVRLQQRNKHGI